METIGIPTLEEHNKSLFHPSQIPQEDVDHPKAGVLCSTCGNEMRYSHPGSVNCSMPPSRTVFCNMCGKTGLKY